MAKLLWAIFLLSSTWAFSTYADESPASPLPPSSSPSPPPPSPSCESVALAMMSCLDYVTEGSNVTAPPPDCCSEVKSIVLVNPMCLCEGVRMAPKFGVVLNMTRAINLTQECAVETPDLHGCETSPVPSPTPPVVPSPTPTPPPISEPTPTPPVSPPPVPEPTPAPPVSPPPVPEPSPTPPVSPPPVSKPSPVSPPTPAPAMPPVEPPSYNSNEVEPPTVAASSSAKLSSSLMASIIVGTVVASFSYLVV